MRLLRIVIINSCVFKVKVCINYHKVLKNLNLVLNFSAKFGNIETFSEIYNADRTSGWAGA